MSVKLKLIDIHKLKKSGFLATAESEPVLKNARDMLKKQEEFMRIGGMDREKLRAFINSDYWTAKQRQKAREELLRFHSELKADMKQAADQRRKEISQSRRLLEQNGGDSASGPRSRRKRSGYV